MTSLAFGLYATPAGGTRYLADAITMLGLDSSVQITSVTAFREPTTFAPLRLARQDAR
jgi:hypothetical protein